MKHPWLVAIAILPSVGAADIADATTHKDIAGHSAGKESVTVFAEFLGNTTMAQQQEGDKPRRAFHRC